MKPEILTWLEDIDRSIVEIYDFLPEKRDFLSFQNDLKTKKAIERNLEIIGEALNRILKEDPSIQITDSRKIVDTRNRIIHGYDSVTPDIIWLIISKPLPVLQKEVRELLTQTEIK
jgi:uncharacterized protein with HEPN domain